MDGSVSVSFRQPILAPSNHEACVLDTRSDPATPHVGWDRHTRRCDCDKWYVAGLIPFHQTVTGPRMGL